MSPSAGGARPLIVAADLLISRQGASSGDRCSLDSPVERNMTINRTVLAIIATCLLVGCSSSTRTVRVAVPPRVDLRPYPVVGLVMFTSNANGDLERLTTQRFLEQVQAAQPGTKVVELGSSSDVLSSVGHHSWDASAFRAVKEKHGVDVLVMGQ